MIPHISLTEMFYAAAVVFSIGLITGVYITYKIEGGFRRKKKS